MSAFPIPRRDDQVAAWIKRRRDAYDQQHDVQWDVLDELLDDYRLHADAGVPLDQHVCEGGTPDDCSEGHGAAQQPTTSATEWGVRTETGYVLGPLTEQVARHALNPQRALVRRTATYSPWTEVETTP